MPPQPHADGKETLSLAHGQETPPLPQPHADEAVLTPKKTAKTQLVLHLGLLFQEALDGTMIKGKGSTRCDISWARQTTYEHLV